MISSQSCAETKELSHILHIFWERSRITILSIKVNNLYSLIDDELIFHGIDISINLSRFNQSNSFAIYMVATIYDLIYLLYLSLLYLLLYMCYYRRFLLMTSMVRLMVLDNVIYLWKGLLFWLTTSCT